ncbi:glycosyltransferase [Poriferisphaera sp. WC338]|uniref:glycosyltransferase n=1 Tax=Poriferisphaera sp. WC338 TaxID=3425129 RepID=UPI003D813350
MPSPASQNTPPPPSLYQPSDSPKDILIIAIGSYGDVFPLLHLASTLQSTGHHITFATRPGYKHLANDAGVPFTPLGDDELFEEMAGDPDLWHPTKGPLLIIDKAIPNLLQPVYNLTEKHYKTSGNNLIVLTPALGMGARIARQKYPFRLVMTQLQPLLFQSVHAPYRASHAIPDLTRLPKLIRVPVTHTLYYFLNKYTDRLMFPVVNPFISNHGLDTVKRNFFASWIHSPDINLALFPEAFCPAQPDWPPHTHHIGFPPFELDLGKPFTAKLQSFLDKHSAADQKPLLFTPGSENRHAQTFFQSALAATQNLDRPAIFATQFTEHLPYPPKQLPEHVLHVPYAPFAKLLPHCAAIIHHGGIGTTARAITTATPQLIMPLSHDQPDNASRVRRLDIGDYLPPKKFTPRRLSQKLDYLLTKPRIAGNCKQIAEIINRQTITPDRLDQLTTQ